MAPPPRNQNTQHLSALGRCDRDFDRDACDRRPGNTVATGVATGASDRRALVVNSCDRSLR
eukprot:15453311-Alexandrium_andersonii.AAC.1